MEEDVAVGHTALHESERHVVPCRGVQDHRTRKRMKRQQVARRDKRDGERLPERLARRLHDPRSMPDGGSRTKSGVVAEVRTV